MPYRRTFLSKWFHKEPLTSEEPFCFTKGSLWWKKVLQIKGKEQMFFKEPLTEWFFMEPKKVKGKGPFCHFPFRPHILHIISMKMHVATYKRMHLWSAICFWWFGRSKDMLAYTVCTIETIDIIEWTETFYILQLTILIFLWWNIIPCN